MANQVFLTFFKEGKPLAHPIEVENGDPVSSIHELDHQVLYLGHEQFFARKPIRVHKPVRFVTPLEKVTPQLMAYLITGEHFEKAQITWLQYNEKTKKESQYFTHLFEDVKIQHVRIVLPDVKDVQYARYDHLAELSFRYRRITWTYLLGNLIFADEWKTAYEEEMEGEEVDLYADAEAVALEEVPPEKPVEGKKVRLSNAKFLPEEGKTDFKGKCKVRVDVEYLGATDKKRVTFKLFSVYKEKIQDMQHVVDIVESGGKAEGEVTLFYNDDYFSDNARTADAKAEYFCKVSHAESDEIESDKLNLPYKKPITCQFVEIPDVLFNHNSAVPMIDADEKLINAIVTTFAFTSKNPDKETTIFGHTDSSGETDYNIKLSELRCKTVKAFLDNKPQDFVNICKDKSNVEDYQTFLSVLTKKYSWDCDPGSIDNQGGPKTKEALKNFQTDYNLFYTKSIDEDGVIGSKTWEAFFNVIMEIITGYAGTADKPPTLKYAKGNGIHPCGEKFAQDAYAKKGRKSQKDRRVEIVFNDTTQPIEDTPYVDTIVMEPVEIKGDRPEQPAGSKIKAISAQCQHTKEGARKAFWGETLEITPDAIGDKVTFTVDTTSPAENISWIGPGIKAGTTGYSIKHNFSGIKNELKNWLFNLASGLPPWIPDAPVKITAIDTLSKDKKHVLVQVYPCAKTEFDFDAEFGKYLKKIKKITDFFQKICDFLGSKAIEFKYLEGKITAYAQYKEDKNTKAVFLSFGVEGGFKPLIGAKTELKFPLDGLPWIPGALKKYVAEIAAVFELEGNINLVVYAERSEIKAAELGGKISGEIVTKLGLRAQLWRGKLLDVKMLVISGITGEGKVFGKLDRSGKNDKVSFEGELSAEWNGLKGQLSWKIFDGTFEDDLTITIKSPAKLGSVPLVFIGDKPNDQK